MKAIGIDVPALSAAARQCGESRCVSRAAAGVFLRQGNVRRRPAGDRYARRRWTRPRRGTRAARRGRSGWRRRRSRRRRRRTSRACRTAKVDYMPGLTQRSEEGQALAHQLQDVPARLREGAIPDVIPFYQTRTHGLYGIGIDAVGALECWGYNYPGFEGMNLDPKATGRMSFTARGDATPKESYNFHFPDGNASVARLLMRALIPGVAAGHDGRGQRDREGRLQPARSRRRADSHASWQHRGARPSCRQRRRPRKKSKSSTAARRSSTPCERRASCSRAGT